MTNNPYSSTDHHRDRGGYDTTFDHGDGGSWQNPYGDPYGWHSRPGSDPGRGDFAGQSQQLHADSERTWAVLSHLAAPVATLLTAGGLSIVGPLIVWAVFKNQSTYVRRAAAASFNFNLILWLGSILGWAMVFTLVLAPVGGLLLLTVLISTFVVHGMAAVEASRGGLYRYPVEIPILS